MISVVGLGNIDAVRYCKAVNNDKFLQILKKSRKQNKKEV